MATVEEVDLLIKTTADVSGARQVSNALSQTQQAATQVQNQLSAGQQAANAALRQGMAGSQGTLADFKRNVTDISNILGTAPTLGPQAFGLSGQIAQQHTQATQQVRRSLASATEDVVAHTEAQQELRTGLNLTTGEFVRFAAAGLGIGTGLSLASTAGHLLASGLSDVIRLAVDADQSVRNLTATFGSAAAGYQQFATTLSRAGGGFDPTAIQGAIESVRPLAEQFNLTTNQVEGLVNAARELATIRDIPLSTALDALLGSLLGNAAAAEKLGLSMTDQQVGARAAGGAYRQTFDTLTDGEKVLLRYAELLKQVDTQQKNVAGSGPSVTTQAREITNQINTLNTTLGQGPLSGFLELLNALGHGLGDTTEKQKSLTKATQDWTAQVEAAQQLTAGGPSLTPPPRTFGPAPLQGLETTGPQALAAAQQALQQLQTAITSVGNATDAQLTALARHMAEVMVLNQEAAQHTIESAGLVTNALQVAINRTTDPTERARLQQRMDAINSVASAQQGVLQAQRAQADIQDESVQLTAQEAQIRLQMLPAQERMLELQNATTQAQLRAQQATVGTSRAQQDLQDQIQLATDIARSADRPQEERQAALARATALTRRVPETDIAALQARIAALPAQRAAEDVQAQARLQGLQQQAAMFDQQFRIDQLTLLGQIVAGIEKQAQRELNVTLQSSLTINQEGAISADDEQRIVTTANAQMAELIHQGVQSINGRGALSQLLGASNP